MITKPNFIKNFVYYLGKNGYSDPTCEKRYHDVSKLISLPVKIWRILLVLRGIYFDRRFDRKYNVNTSGAAYLRDLNIKSENVLFGELYDPFPYRSFKRLLSLLPMHDFSDAIFIDFGSGKGRVLLIASEYNFRAIIGVEFSQKLHEIAVANIKSFMNRNQKCSDIKSVFEDATKFSIPNYKCIFFIFAAFQGEVFLKVLENIKHSFHANPRSMTLFYVTDPNTHPIPWNDILQINIFRKVRSGPFPFDLSQRYTLEYAIFKTKDHFVQLDLI